MNKDETEYNSRVNQKAHQLSLSLTQLNSPEMNYGKDDEFTPASPQEVFDPMTFVNIQEGVRESFMDYVPSEIYSVPEADIPLSSDTLEEMLKEVISGDDYCEETVPLSIDDPEVGDDTSNDKLTEPVVKKYNMRIKRAPRDDGIFAYDYANKKPTKGNKKEENTTEKISCSTRGRKAKIATVSDEGDEDYIESEETEETATSRRSTRALAGKATPQKKLPKGQVGKAGKKQIASKESNVEDDESELEEPIKKGKGKLKGKVQQVTKGKGKRRKKQDVESSDDDENNDEDESSASENEEDENEESDDEEIESTLKRKRGAVKQKLLQPKTKKPKVVKVTKKSTRAKKESESDVPLVEFMKKNQQTDSVQSSNKTADGGSSEEEDLDTTVSVEETPNKGRKKRDPILAMLGSEGSRGADQQLSVEENSNMAGSDDDSSSNRRLSNRAKQGSITSDSKSGAISEQQEDAAKIEQPSEVQQKLNAPTREVPVGRNKKKEKNVLNESRNSSEEEEGKKVQHSSKMADHGESFKKLDRRRDIEDASHDKFKALRAEREKATMKKKEHELSSAEKIQQISSKSKDDNSKSSKSWQSASGISTDSQLKGKTSIPCRGPGCQKSSFPKSVYCSMTCIQNHALHSLQLLENDRNKAAYSRSSVSEASKIAASKSNERIVVFERQTGKLLTGPAAPTEASLATWLEKHPTFEVLLSSNSTQLSTTSSSAVPSSNLKKVKRLPDKKVIPTKEVKDVRTTPVVKEAPKQEQPVLSSFNEKIDQEMKVDLEMKKQVEARSTQSKGPDPTRISIRNSLRETLYARANETDDVMLSSSEIKLLALDVEEELFNYYGGITTKYKHKFRTLITHLKDVKNKGLFRKILFGELKPYKLVRLSIESLGSQELARWKDVASMAPDVSPPDKMIKKPETTAKSPYYDPNYDYLSTIINETTSEHGKHFFDINCKVCTGKVPEPLYHQQHEETKKVSFQSPKEKNVSTKDASYDQSFLRRGSMEEEIVEESVPVVRDPPKKAIKMPLLPTPALLKTPVIIPLSPAPITSTTSKEELLTWTDDDLVWQGTVFAHEITSVKVHAYLVSGTLIPSPTSSAKTLLYEDLPDTIQMTGRLPPDNIYSYLVQLKSSGAMSRDMTVIQLQPAEQSDGSHYKNLFNYLSNRNRCGVITCSGSHTVKDLYIIPLSSRAIIPSVLLPFDGPGLPENRSNLLLGVVVKYTKPLNKTPATKTWMYSERTDTTEEQTFGSTGRQANRHRNTENTPSQIPAKQVDQQTATGISSTKSLNETQVGSTVELDEMSDSEADAEIFDSVRNPTLSSTKVSKHNSEKTKHHQPAKLMLIDEDDDKPYDPFDEKDESDSEPATAAKNEKDQETSTANAAIPAQTTSSQVGITLNQLLLPIGQMTDPAEITAAMLKTVAAVTSAGNLEDQTRLLLELTEKINEQKIYLEKQRQELDSVENKSTEATAGTDNASQESLEKEATKIMSEASSNHTPTSVPISFAVFSTSVSTASLSEGSDKKASSNLVSEPGIILNLARQRLARKSFEAKIDENSQVSNDSNILTPDQATEMTANEDEIKADDKKENETISEPGFNCNLSVLPPSIHELLSGQSFLNLKSIMATVKCKKNEDAGQSSDQNKEVEVVTETKPQQFSSTPITQANDTAKPKEMFTSNLHGDIDYRIRSTNLELPSSDIPKPPMPTMNLLMPNMPVGPGLPIIHPPFPRPQSENALVNCEEKFQHPPPPCPSKPFFNPVHDQSAKEFMPPPPLPPILPNFSMPPPKRPLLETPQVPPYSVMEMPPMPPPSMLERNVPHPTVGSEPDSSRQPDLRNPPQPRPPLISETPRLSLLADPPIPEIQSRVNASEWKPTSSRKLPTSGFRNKFSKTSDKEQLESERSSRGWRGFSNRGRRDSDRNRDSERNRDDDRSRSDERDKHGYHERKRSNKRNSRERDDKREDHWDREYHRKDESRSRDERRKKDDSRTRDERSKKENGRPKEESRPQEETKQKTENKPNEENKTKDAQPQENKVEGDGKVGDHKPAAAAAMKKLETEKVLNLKVDKNVKVDYVVCDAPEEGEIIEESMSHEITDSKPEMKTNLSSQEVIVIDDGALNDVEFVREEFAPVVVVEDSKNEDCKKEGDDNTGKKSVNVPTTEKSISVDSGKASKSEKSSQSRSPGKEKLDSNRKSETSQDKHLRSRSRDKDRQGSSRPRDKSRSPADRAGNKSRWAQSGSKDQSRHSRSRDRPKRTRSRSRDRPSRHRRSRSTDNSKRDARRRSRDNEDGMQTRTTGIPSLMDTANIPSLMDFRRDAIPSLLSMIDMQASKTDETKQDGLLGSHPVQELVKTRQQLDDGILGKYPTDAIKPRLNEICLLGRHPSEISLHSNTLVDGILGRFPPVLGKEVDPKYDIGENNRRALPEGLLPYEMTMQQPKRKTLINTPPDVQPNRSLPTGDFDERIRSDVGDSFDQPNSQPGMEQANNNRMELPAGFPRKSLLGDFPATDNRPENFQPSKSFQGGLLEAQHLQERSSNSPFQPRHNKNLYNKDIESCVQQGLSAIRKETEMDNVQSRQCNDRPMTGVPGFSRPDDRTWKSSEVNRPEQFMDSIKSKDFPKPEATQKQFKLFMPGQMCARPPTKSENDVVQNFGLRMMPPLMLEGMRIPGPGVMRPSGGPGLMRPPRPDGMRPTGPGGIRASRPEGIGSPGPEEIRPTGPGGFPQFQHGIQGPRPEGFPLFPPGMRPLGPEGFLTNLSGMRAPGLEGFQNFSPGMQAPHPGGAQIRRPDEIEMPVKESQAQEQVKQPPRPERIWDSQSDEIRSLEPERIAGPWSEDKSFGLAGLAGLAGNQEIPQGMRQRRSEGFQSPETERIQSPGAEGLRPSRPGEMQQFGHLGSEEMRFRGPRGMQKFRPPGSEEIQAHGPPVFRQQGPEGMRQPSMPPGFRLSGPDSTGQQPAPRRPEGMQFPGEKMQFSPDGMPVHSDRRQQYPSDHFPAPGMEFSRDGMAFDRSLGYVQKEIDDKRSLLPTPHHLKSGERSAGNVDSPDNYRKSFKTKDDAIHRLEQSSFERKGLLPCPPQNTQQLISLMDMPLGKPYPLMQEEGSSTDESRQGGQSRMPQSLLGPPHRTSMGESRHGGRSRTPPSLFGPRESRHSGQPESRHGGGLPESRHGGGPPESRRSGGLHEFRHGGGPPESRHGGGPSESQHGDRQRRPSVRPLLERRSDNFP